MKSKVDHLDIDKLKYVQNNLKKLIDAVDKCKPKCNTNKKDLDKKIADVNRLVTNTAFNTKVREVEKKNVPDVIRLVTNTALNIQIEKVKKNSGCYWISTKIRADEETFLMILNIYSRANI